MTTMELDVLKENRLEGESLNVTKERLLREGKLLPKPINESDSSENFSIGDEDGLFKEDLAIPRWKIIQPSCRIEKATNGTFHNTLTGEEKEKLEDVVFLKRYNGRILFPKDDFSGERECWSYDGFLPAKEEILAKKRKEPKSSCCLQKINGQKVISCPFAMWNNEEGVNGNRSPMCKETIAFLAVDKEFMPFWIGFHGASIPLIKKLISYVYLQKKQSAVKGEDLHLRDFRLIIGLKMQINEKGKFHIPIFEKTEKIKEESERNLLKDCFDALQQKEISDTFDLEEKVGQ